MAEIAAVVTEISGGAHLIAWEGLAQGDTGRPIQFVGGRDRTAQVFGTFGGANVVIEGSLQQVDPTNFETLTDLFSNALSFSANGIDTITELVTNIRPRVVNGNGTTAVNVYVLFGGTK